MFCFVAVFLCTSKNVTQFVIIVDYICSFKVVAFCFLVKSKKARQTLKWKNSFGGKNRGPVEDNKENKILITHNLIIQSNARERPLVAHWLYFSDDVLFKTATKQHHKETTIDNHTAHASYC